MADQTATPATGAEQAAVPTDEASAIARIQGLLEPQPEAPQKPEAAAPEATRQAEPVEEVEGDEPERVDPEPDEGEEHPDEPSDEPQELPKTLRDLAERLNVDPATLAGELQIEIKGPDGPEVITLAEAIRGTLRESDYTRKTQAHAERERAFEAERNAAAAHWNQKFQELEVSMAAANELLSTGISDADLYAMADPNSPKYDPAAYVAASAERDRRLKHIEGLKAKYAQTRQQQQQEAENQKIRYRAEQQKALAARMPEMRDDGKRKQFESDLLEELPSYGFTREQVAEFMAGPFDHRQVLLAADAIKYRKLQKGKKELTKQVKAMPKKVTAGTPSDTRNSEEARISKARMAVRRSGSKDAAVDFIRNII